MIVTIWLVSHFTYEAKSWDDLTTILRTQVRLVDIQLPTNINSRSSTRFVFQSGNTTDGIFWILYEKQIFCFAAWSVGDWRMSRSFNTPEDDVAIVWGCVCYVFIKTCLSWVSMSALYLDLSTPTPRLLTACLFW